MQSCHLSARVTAAQQTIEVCCAAHPQCYLFRPQVNTDSSTEEGAVTNVWAEEGKSRQGCSASHPAVDAAFKNGVRVSRARLRHCQNASYRWWNIYHHSRLSIELLSTAALPHCLAQVGYKDDECQNAEWGDKEKEPDDAQRGRDTTWSSDQDTEEQDEHREEAESALHHGRW